MFPRDFDLRWLMEQNCLAGKVSPIEVICSLRPIEYAISQGKNTLR
jgi:hypothetical protein